MNEEDYIIGYGGGGKGGGGGGGQEDQNTLFSTAKGRVVDLLSEGEIVGLLNGKKSIHLDGTPVQPASGADNFEGISWASRYGTNTQDYIPGFAGTETTTSVNTVVTNSAPGAVIRSFTSSIVDAVRVGLWVPALTDANNDQGNIHGSSVNFTIHLSKDGGSNYTQVLSTSISGKTTQRFEKSYRFDIPSAWTSFTQITIKVTRTTADVDNAKIVNSLYFGSYTIILDNKLSYPNSALIAMQFNAEQFDSIPTRGYEVKGLKVKVPSNYTAYDPGHCSLGGYRRKDTCVAASGTWTGTAVGANLYNGAWDGTFDTEWTCNPAWILYDLCTEERYGLGKWLVGAQLDKWALYEIAKYCDAVDNSGNFVGVDDGWGNKEARFTCNLYLQSAEEAFKVLNDIAAVFRGLIYWQQGMVSAIQDAPKDPIMNFSAANVLDGSFTYEGSSRKQRHNVAQVTWNNPEDLYKQNVEYVEDAEAIALANNQIFSKNIRALGCTSQSQARRVGKWLLYTERYETEICTFKTGMEANAIKPGDLVKIADSGRSGVRYGGRVSRGNVLKEESLPVMDSGYEFTSGSDHPEATVDIVMDPHTNTRFLAVWISGSGTNYAEVRVGTIAADNSISYGTQYRINAETDSAAQDTKWAYAAFDSDSDNAGKFVVFWNEQGEEKARVGTISGTNISFGNEYNSFISGNATYTATHCSITADPNNDAKFLLVYSDNSGVGKAQICTLSGTSLTFGSEYTFESTAITSYTSSSAISAAFDPNNANKFVIGYIDKQSGAVRNDLKTIVGTISGTSISFGSKYILLENTVVMASVLAIEFNPVGAGEFLLAYNDAGSTPKILNSHCVGGKITGTSVVYGTPVAFKSYEETSPPSLSFDTNYYGRFALSFASTKSVDKGFGSIIQGTMGNYDNIVFGGIFQYATDIERADSKPTDSIMFDPNNSGKLLIGHSLDNDSAGIVTVAQLEVRDSSTRTNIKLDSATPITGGTCSNTSYTTKATCEDADATWTAGPVYNLSLINNESACVRAGVKQTQNTQADCLNAHVDNEWKPYVWVETKPSVTRTETSGDVSEITVTSNYANLPVATNSWILESVGTVEAQDFRILSIRESAPAEYEVSALKYHEAKYALIESNIEFSAKSTSSLPDPSEAVPIPRTLAVSEELYTDSRNVLRNRATFSWLAPYTVGTSITYPYIGSYYVEWRRTAPITNWMSLGSTTSTSMTIDDAPAGDIEFRVKTKRVF